MTVKTKLTLTSREAIRRLKLEAKRALEPDRRQEVRYPFFRPVSIRVGDTHYSAFTRDISSTALGLFHNRAIAAGEVEVSVTLGSGEHTRLPVRIEKCRPCGAGWFISRGMFLRDFCSDD
jgi:hypothetical protein